MAYNQLPSVGQKTMANSLPVVLASDESTLPISASSLPLPSGAAQDSTLTGGLQQSKITDGTSVASVKAASTAAVATDKALVVAVSPNNSVAVTGTFWQSTQPVSIAATLNTSATQSGTWTVQPGNTANTTPWLVQDSPATSGGLSTTVLISAASTNATSLKASAGQVYSIQAFNLNASPRYLKLYNKASSPTVGTDTPVKVFMIPGNTAGAGFTINVDKGVAFATGIAYAITGGIANSDTTAISANEVVVNIDYK